jgi:hypothetical protein
MISFCVKLKKKWEEKWQQNDFLLSGTKIKQAINNVGQIFTINTSPIN